MEEGSRKTYDSRLQNMELEKLKLQKLEKREVLSTRKLWEEVFSEDSREFVDYYYSDKASENTAFVLKDREEIISMLHLTPYQAVLRALQRKEENVSYIVGVATKAIWRHKGCMRKLLHEAFLELYKRKEPFAFLMPADPDIYRPFSFEYIYERKEYSLQEGKLSEEKLVWLAEDNGRSLSLQDNQGETCTIRLANANDIGKLSSFAQAVSEEQYDFYINHTEQYFQVLRKEIESQKGGIFLLERQGKLSAYAVCALDGKAPFFQELLYKEEEKPLVEMIFLEQERRKPVIMGRVMHTETMLTMLESQIEKELILEIEDKDIPANEGIFLWKAGKGYSRAGRLAVKEHTEMKVRIKASIGELTKQIFTGSCGNPALEEAWQGVCVYVNGNINEIV
ncbi:MAG: GNAT family N-acetyltransferase [Lachnospiraceae bacterium]|nr:GNAT family N-acetyltransferase [Lachnospiraceae bacterium]